MRPDTPAGACPRRAHGPRSAGRLATRVALIAGVLWGGARAEARPARTRVAPDARTPQRIASLTLAADEVLVEILPPDRLVAATRAADDPGSSNIVGRLPAALPRFFRAELERLVALQPDLVVVSEYTDADFLALLEASGLPHHRMTGLDSFAGIRQSILDLGRAVGEPGPAQRLVEGFDARLADVADRLAGAGRPRVLYWFNPYTAGRDTAIGALIECAGGRNVGAELGLTGLLPLGAERAFVADPDVVLVGHVPDEAPQDLRAHPLLSRLRAVQADRVVDLPAPLLVTVSQHAARACAALAARLHPDRFGGEAP